MFLLSVATLHPQERYISYKESIFIISNLFDKPNKKYYQCHPDRTQQIESSPSKMGCIHTSYFRPVLPKPPSPLPVSSRESVSSHSTLSYLATTIWAILSPGFTVNGVWDRLTRITPISPL